MGEEVDIALEPELLGLLMCFPVAIISQHPPGHEGRVILEVVMDGDRSWVPYLQRYTQGEWRAPIFRDLILADVVNLSLRGKPALLDIGSGKGFDGSPDLQRSLAQAAGSYLGVEPDGEIRAEPIFSAVHRCIFEEAPISPASVEVAFAVMVLEHLASPRPFWDKLHAVLKPGGVFWGFTMDARHWFVPVSLLAKRLRVKECYLNVLHGNRGKERYENFPVYYCCNTAEQLRQYTKAFRDVTVLNFTKVGQLDYYFPRWLRTVGHALDRWALRRGRPGSILAVRVVK
jgi:SAM-dependent methyltransferase